jgi:hypothetical protein
LREIARENSCPLRVGAAIRHRPAKVPNLLDARGWYLPRWLDWLLHVEVEKPTALEAPRHSTRTEEALTNSPDMDRQAVAA